MRNERSIQHESPARVTVRTSPVVRKTLATFFNLGKDIAQTSTTMICEHLKPLEQAIHERGIKETFRGKPWSMNCREWVYFDCYLDLAAIREQFPLAQSIQDHVHRGTHDGEERGLVCMTCQDAIVGAYEKRPGMSVFPA